MVVCYVGGFDFDFSVPPSCLAQQTRRFCQISICLSRTWAKSGISKTKVNPTQVTDHQSHPEPALFNKIFNQLKLLKFTFCRIRTVFTPSSLAVLPAAAAPCWPCGQAATTATACPTFTPLPSSPAAAATGPARGTSGAASTQTDTWPTTSSRNRSVWNISQ